MKTMEELENELRKWTPCPPSGGLRTRIFGRPAVEPARPERWRASGWNQARLALASAVGLALVIAIRSNPPALPVSGEAHRAMFAAAMSNQDFAAYVSPRENQEWNLPAASFRSTNLGQSLNAPSLRNRSQSR
jgi:hypothetical protein